MFVPCVNVVVGIMMLFKLAKAFGQGTGFGFGLLFLNTIFILILGIVRVATDFTCVLDYVIGFLSVSVVLAILYYAVLNNRMMAYVERQLYPLPHEAPSRRSGAP